MADNHCGSFALRLGVAAVICAFSLGSSIALAQRVATANSEHAREIQRVTIDVDDAPLATVLSTIARQAGLMPVFNPRLVPVAKRVTLHLHEIAVIEAFEHALRGTGFTATVLSTGNVLVVGNSTPISSGSIVGHVIAAVTKQPLPRAKIGLDGMERVVETAEDGSYYLPSVSTGAHTVTVKLLGYTKMTRTTMVQDNITTTVDFALDISATPLGQVVVTGTVVPTELKAVPSAITIITAKQIEERGITKIDQLFRGDVPGLFAQNQGSNALLDEVTMFSRGATALSGNSLGISTDPGLGVPFLTNPIKTYVDGIELANSKYLSQIDPKSIERIEILTGPQASTIYGSNAINGVMQIFTKRGSTSRPQLTLNLLSGFVQNNFSSAHTPQHDYSASLSGVEGRLSYNAGGTWNYMGPWTPAKQLARTGGFGGARLDLPTSVGRVTADVSLRRSITQSLQRGDASQTSTGYRETGWYSGGSAGRAAPTTWTLTGQSLGVTLSYAPASWWSHELGLGTDVSNSEQRRTARGYTGIFDTTLVLLQDGTDRRSVRYSTTARVPITSTTQLTVTTGVDNWQNLTSSIYVSPQTLTGTLTGNASVSRQPSHNTGGFVQSQLSLKDRLFFTYGLRAEWNPDYGEKAEPNMAPRYGIAYTQELGSVTAKLRGAYGRSTRPPQPTLKVVQTIADIFGPDWSSTSSSFFPYYGIFDYVFANPDLGPEHQQGGEGGLELYFGTRSSLVITRYNQTVDGLIAQPVVDSVRTSVPCNTFSPECEASSIDSDGYGYYPQFQNLNLGSIRNQGWELQGSVAVGPITTHGTYSWTKSRTIGVIPKYRSLFPPTSYPQYQPGATFQYLPEHTWAFGMTYASAGSSIGFNVMGTGQAMNQNDDFYFHNLSARIRLRQNRLNVSNTRYVNFNVGYAMIDLTASHRFASRVEGILQVQNLADRYTNDFYADYASIGRQVKLGARIQ